MGSNHSCCTLPGSRVIKVLRDKALGREVLISWADVFLTTMKPREKVVTAQDVQSSLYYLHLNNPNDYGILQSVDSEICVPEATKAPSRKTTDFQSIVHRKPLPPRANAIDSFVIEPTPASSVNGKVPDIIMSHGAHLARKSVQTGSIPAHHGSEAAPALPPRPVLGPRSMHQRLHSVDNMALQNIPRRQNIDVRRWSEQPRGLPSRLLSHDSDYRHTSIAHQANKPTEPMANGPDMATGGHCWAWEKQWEGRRVSEAQAEMARISSDWQADRISNGKHEPSSLTLIRRYNNEQWNVGKLMEDDQGDIATSSPTVGSAILVEITTAGYAKFNAVGQGQDTSIKDLKKAAIDLNMTDTVPFHRYLQLPRATTKGRQSNGQNLSDHRLIERLERPRLERGFTSSCHSRTSIDDRPTPKDSMKVYTIKSPWNGICEFSTGVAGRSLKCKHSYASKDPMYAPGIVSVTVSELRFNLPSSTVFGASSPKVHTPGNHQERKRSSLFMDSFHRRNSSHDSKAASEADQIEDRLDLSLGQEHAGGGFGGKQAKLGKLIIQPEGLQMLDFIVAANMALWWKVYERLM